MRGTGFTPSRFPATSHSRFPAGVKRRAGISKRSPCELTVRPRIVALRLPGSGACGGGGRRGAAIPSKRQRTAIGDRARISWQSVLDLHAGRRTVGEEVAIGGDQVRVV